MHFFLLLQRLQLMILLQGTAPVSHASLKTIPFMCQSETVFLFPDVLKGIPRAQNTQGPKERSKSGQFWRE